MTDTPQNRVEVRRIYIKDASFESPEGARSIKEAAAPHIDLNIGTKPKPLDAEQTYEVVLSATITASVNKQTLYIVEVQQAGEFLVAGFEKEALERVLNAYCPHLLFPFLREAVSDFVQKGGFAQLLLQPLNFDALFDQHRHSVKQAADEASQDPVKH